MAYAGIRQLEVKADITRNDVEEYFGLDGYGCHCVAWSSFGQVKSRRAKVAVSCEFKLYLFINMPQLRRLRPEAK